MEASAVVAPAGIEGDVVHPEFGGVDLHVHPDLEGLMKDVPVAIEETRRGWKTSEFWTGLAAVFVDLGLEVDSKNKILVTGLAALYAIARGLAKNGTPNVTPVP